MIFNEKGFAFPVSLSILLLFSTFLLINTQYYLTEKKLLNETETILKQEYYLLRVVRNLEEKVRLGEAITSGEFQFLEGRAVYSREEVSAASYRINITLTLSTGEKTLGFAYFDKNSKEMISWVEKN